MGPYRGIAATSHPIPVNTSPGGSIVRIDPTRQSKSRVRKFCTPAGERGKIVMDRGWGHVAGKRSVIEIMPIHKIVMD